MYIDEVIVRIGEKLATIGMDAHAESALWHSKTLSGYMLERVGGAEKRL